MPLDERELRMSALRRREKMYDVHHWVSTFLKSTGAFNGDGMPGANFQPLTIDNFETWLGRYVSVVRGCQ